MTGTQHMVVITKPGHPTVRFGPAGPATAADWHRRLGAAAGRSEHPRDMTIKVVPYDPAAGCEDPADTIPATAFDLVAPLMAEVPGDGKGGNFPDLFDRISMVHGADRADRLWETACRIADAIEESDPQPCPPPDMLAGQDMCPGHPQERWPCQDTRIAWRARGLDPDTEARRIATGIARDTGTDPAKA